MSGQLGSVSPQHPSFELLPNGFGMDNPDNHYLSAPIDARLDYRITGSEQARATSGSWPE